MRRNRTEAIGCDAIERVNEDLLSMGNQSLLLKQPI